MTIAWQAVAFDFDGEPVLEPSDFVVKAGTWVGVMGPNGGGKTTLLRLLLGFLKPKRGKISVLGTDPVSARPRVGYVPQLMRADRQFPITVQEIIELGTLNQKRDVCPWMERLGLTPYKDKPLSALSGGTVQKTLLARALVSEPELLLLDEPTANVDPPTAAAILEFLGTLDITIVHVTHDVKTIVEKVDQILCVQQTIKSYLPNEVCEHFAMGLYHTPLLGLPPQHWK